MDQVEKVSQLQKAYQEALLNRDRSAAADVINESLQYGLTIKQVYLKIILSTQKRVGELWSKGKLSVAAEHLATEISLAEIGRLRGMLRPQGSRDKSVVVCAVTSDQHTLGARVVADFFIMDGWTVHYLGGDLPKDELIRFVKEQAIDLVALSITLEDYFEETRSLINELKCLPKQPKVIVGGWAVTADMQKAKALKADVIAFTADDAIDQGQKLFRLGKSPVTLEDYLRRMGSRLRDIRKARRVNQKTLAELADLDRAYISGVENGKQNISIGALFRMSQVLEINMADLFAGVER